MSEKERLVRFTLLGQEYVFYTGASEEEMSRILSLVKQHIEASATGSESGNIAASKTAVLACLNLASRYLKLQQDFEEFKQNSDVKASRLINEIDAVLAAEKR